MKNNITSLIKKSGKTLTLVAKLSGISRVYLSDLARGEKPLNERVMIKIAKALEVTPSELIGNSTLSSVLTIPLYGFINPGGVVEILEQEEISAQHIVCPTSMNPAETLAFESHDSRFYNGFIVFAEKPMPGVPSEFVGCICIVEVGDVKMVKRIERGAKPGLYNLYHPASDHDPMRDCLVRSTSFVRHMEQRPKAL